MAEAFGVNTFGLRVQVFVLSALMASLSGWLYAHNQRFLNPTPSASRPASSICSWLWWAARSTSGAA
ncbi:hypothetical protein ACFSC4_23015 [Deinococcus malanensis]|uniref:hypothetical protein n=1 Tax=Deinococcus malanensis TaxID=1706855 RepID=UPI00363BD4EF